MDTDDFDRRYPRSERFNEIRFNVFVGKETNQGRSAPGLGLGPFAETLPPVGGRPSLGFHLQPPLLIVAMQFFQVGVDFIPVPQTIPDYRINIPKTEPEVLRDPFRRAVPVNESLNHSLERHPGPHNPDNSILVHGQRRRLRQNIQAQGITSQVMLARTRQTDRSLRLHPPALRQMAVGAPV